MPDASSGSTSAGSVAYVTQLLDELILQATAPWDVTESHPVSPDFCPVAYSAVLEAVASDDAVSAGSDSDRTPLIRDFPSSGHSGCDIIHLRVAQQYGEMHCGHHAMYNVLCLTSALRHAHKASVAGEPSSTRSSGCVGCSQSAERCFNCLRSAPSLWKRYWYTVGKLSAHCRELGSTCWPWDVDTIQRGLVERTYLRYLLQEDDALLCAQTFCPLMEIQVSLTEALDGLLANCLCVGIASQVCTGLIL